jgi:ubiquinone/menaquinone biosynthesis C-methylase UbiE
MEQRFTFDQIASVYRTTRPDYPEALTEDVVSFAGLKPNDKILEIGCGTGQATKSFAKRGFQLLATEPGSETLRSARESLASFGNIEFLETTFEAWPAAQQAFRLIIAAQSWHWLSAEVRFAKAAEVLSEDGSLAVFGNVPVRLPAPILAQFKEIYLRQIGRWGPAPEAWYLPNGPFEAWFDGSGQFGRAEHKSYAWKWRHTTSSYTDFLRTRSDHRILESAKREEVISEITKVIADHGGRLTVDYETHLYIARRLRSEATIVMPPC